MGSRGSRVKERAEVEAALEDYEHVHKRVSYANLLVMLVLITLTVWQTVKLVVVYCQYGVVTSVVKEFSSSVVFPSVTICNYNRWKLSLISNTPQQLEVLLAYSEKNGMQVGPGSNGATSSTPVDLYNFTVSTGWQLIDAENEARWPGRNKTLLRCSFGSQTCNTKFFKHRMTTFGNCFTFNYNASTEYNSSGDGSTWPASYPLNQSHVSETSGLSLLIDIEKDDYSETTMTDGTQLYGLKVLIHPDYEEPDPSTQGLSVSPASQATVAVTKTEYFNMEPPYGSCNASATLSNGELYTLSGCDTDCKISQVERNCSCLPFYYSAAGAKQCAVLPTLTCANPMVAKINGDFTKYCACPNPCNYEDYDYSVSYAAFPSATMGTAMATLYNMEPAHYNSSVVSLVIYMKEIGQTTVTQSEAKTSDSVISEFGGILALFLGASCATVVDIVEKLTPSVLVRLRRRRQVAANVEDQEASTTNKITIIEADSAAATKLKRRRSLVTSVNFN